MTLSKKIDDNNYAFINAVKESLHDLSGYSDAALEWLMMEHYQFSARNCEFLTSACDNTKQFPEDDVSLELQRNYEEEKFHATMYKKALNIIGTNVEKRIEFQPTTDFFNKIAALISNNPSVTLGTMYATETAAIFEHEVFLAISKEVVMRRYWYKSRLKAFHDMHLDGVEQGHKDGLGNLVDAAIPSIEKEKVAEGANKAIETMAQWWKSLLDNARNI